MQPSKQNSKPDLSPSVFTLPRMEKAVRVARADRLAKSILDAAWGIFLSQLTYKAEWAGRHAIAVDPRGTSQTCPDCGAVKKKKLSERTHECICGLTCDRDHAAARVILLRALASRRGVSPVEELVTLGGIRRHQIGPMKQEVLIN